MEVDIKALTEIHVAISLIAILQVWLYWRELTNTSLRRWTAVFLGFTVATSATGFLFPFHGFTPAIEVGIISLILLAIAIFALYLRHALGHWRWIYNRHCSVVALSERICTHRPAISKGACSTSFGTDAN